MSRSGSGNPCIPEAPFLFHRPEAATSDLILGTVLLLKRKEKFRPLMRTPAPNLPACRI